MTTVTRTSRWKRLSALVSLCATLTATQAHAINVDTELVLLVDAQTFNQSDFDLILDGVAQSFEQQTFIDSVAAGPFGRIAATVVLFNSNNGETIGIPWMELSSPADLQNFATSVRNLPNPTPFGNVSYAGAISTGAAQIASSAFDGTLRQLTLIDDGTGFFEANPTGTRAARDTALASSVDVINAVVFDAAFRVDAVETFYNDNIVGGPGGSVTVVESPQGGPKSAAFTAEIGASIVSAATTPTVDAAAVSANAIPEPSSVFLVVTAGLGILAHRRR